jgi:hypothetical protein
MALIKRLVKGTPLTFAEGDDNLTYLEGLATNTGSFAVTNAPNNFQGDQAIFGNLTVYGTSSVSYVSQSQINIGSNLLVLNTDTPSVRFGGMVVYDSGSTQLSGSLLWDSIRHYWVYNTPSGSNYDGAMLISGPKNTTGLGNEQGLLLNVITKGQGTDHITSSALIEDGTYLRVAVNTLITGSLTTTGTITGSLFGTSSYAVSASQAISSSYALSASYALSSSYSFTGSFAQNARSSSYALTSSYTRNAELLDGLDSTVFSSTASFTNFTASITNYTASNDLMVADILIATASLNAATSSLYAFSSSILTTTASLYAFSSSIFLATASLYAFTASILNNTSSGIQDSSSFNNRINIISGSYATTGSNIFTADQTIQGSLTVNRIVVQTVTASQTYSSGSNVFGNLLTNTQTFTGSLQVTGSSHYVLGQLGVGTITPGFTLHLSKAAENNIAIDNTANNNRLLISSRTNNTSILSQNPNTLSPVDLVFTIGLTDTMRVSAASVNITGSLTVSGSGTFNNIGPANFSGSTYITGSLFNINSVSTNITGSVYSTGSLFNINNVSTNITGSIYSTGLLFNVNNVSTNISSSLNVTGSTFNWNGSQVVTLAASQTISGAKTFSAATVFSSTTSHTGTAGFGVGSPTVIDGTDGRIITDKIRLYANLQPASQYHNIVSAATQNRDLVIPNVSGTVITTGDTGTVTNAMLAGSIANAKLASSTISGVSLGSNLYTLTQGSGLEYSAGSAYNGSAASTIGIAALGVTNAMLAGSIANSKLSNSTISGIALGSNLATLTLNTSGTGLSGSTTYNGSGAATFTVTSNATSANTADTIVARDGSGNFSAGTITATLSGVASSITSQANSATITATSSNTDNQIVLRNSSGGFSSGTVNVTGSLLVNNGSSNPPSTFISTIKGDTNIHIASNDKEGVLYVSNNNFGGNTSGVAIGYDLGAIGGTDSGVIAAYTTSSDPIHLDLYSRSSSLTQFRFRMTSGGRLNLPGLIESTTTYSTTSGTASNMVIDSSGVIQRSTASSQRFKNNITDWSANGLEIILSLKPKTFTYKEEHYSNPERQFLGLIAEEVAEVSSYLADYENEDGTGQVENVRYANIVVPLIKAFQEQNEIITKQGQAIQELKAEIDILKAK